VAFTCLLCSSCVLSCLTFSCDSSQLCALFISFEVSKSKNPSTKHVTEGLLKCHKNLVKIVAATSLDPKRARQATVEARNAMFFRSWLPILRFYMPWVSFHGNHTLKLLPVQFTIWMNLGMIQQNTETKLFKREQTLALNRLMEREHSCALPKETEECHGILQYAWQLAQMVRLIVEFFCLCLGQDGWLLGGWVSKYCSYSLTL